MEPVITDREYLVHYYEIDYKKRMLISSIMNFFNDVSMLQSTSVGMGIDYHSENKIAWVLFKWNINIERYPMYGEKIKVRTIPYSFRKFYAYRKYEVYDEKGNIIITADSIWFLIDTDRRRPKKVPEVMYEAYGIDHDRNEPIEIDNIDDIEQVDTERQFTVRYGDIDTNGHVNNVKYYSWAVDTIPVEIMTQYGLKNLKVIYKKETKYGDTVKVLTKINHRDDGIVVCNHKIINEQGEELTLLQTSWKKEE